MRRCTRVVFFLFLFNIMALGQQPTGTQAPDAQQAPSGQQPPSAGQQPPSEQQVPSEQQPPAPRQTPSAQPQSETPNAPEPQEAPEPPEPRSMPRWELFAGYTYVGADPFSIGTHSPLHGWEANVSLNAARWLAIVADLGGSYGTTNVPIAVPTPFPPCPPLCPGGSTSFPVTTHLYTYLFGGRVPYRRWERFTPYAEVLYGRAHVSGEILGTSEIDTKGAIAGGLGADFAISQRLAWRVQGEYLRTKFFTFKENNYRLSTGIVLRWTHKKKRRTLTTP